MTAEDAAEKAVDPDRLLQGEDPSTRYPEDATHWMRVYAELLGYKRDLLQVTRARVAEMEKSAAAEVEKTDLVVLTAEGERLARRLEFWTGRAKELGGS